MNILAIIPARGGSKSIIKKNIIDLCGQPLIHYTLNAAKKSDHINDIIVATDDSEIAACCEIYKPKIYWRDSQISGDRSTTQELLRQMFNNEKLVSNADLIILLQPTSPLRDNKHIDAAIDLALENLERDTTVVSIQELPHQFNPKQVFKITNCDQILANSEDKIRRRQDKEKYYARNGAAIYIFAPYKMTTDILSGNLIGYKMNKISSIDIDDIDDLKIAEAIIKNDIE